jgi:hypothetical protein
MHARDVKKTDNAFTEALADHINATEQLVTARNNIRQKNSRNTHGNCQQNIIYLLLKLVHLENNLRQKILNINR